VSSTTPIAPLGQALIRQYSVNDELPNTPAYWGALKLITKQSSLLTNILAYNAKLLIMVKTGNTN
jgi:hypothetical protein